MKKTHGKPYKFYGAALWRGKRDEREGIFEAEHIYQCKLGMVLIRESGIMRNRQPEYFTYFSTVFNGKQFQMWLDCTGLSDHSLKLNANNFLKHCLKQK